MTGPGRVTDPASPWCQRWAGRRHSWRHTSEGGFDPRRFDVARIGEATAKPFVIASHYAGSMPAARMCWGLYADDLVGVAVLSVPMRPQVTGLVFPDLAAYDEALELGRFVLADAVPANAESWFLARVFRAAAAEGIRGVVSFADPAPRVTAAGDVVMPGHVGTIYQAANAVYCGRSTPRTLRVLPDATVFSARAASKIRSGERGRRYAAELLVRHGARPPGPDDDPVVWLAEALAATTVPRRHRGAHRYAFVLGRTRTERARVRVAVPGRAYPKTIDEPLTT